MCVNSLYRQKLDNLDNGIGSNEDEENAEGHARMVFNRTRRWIHKFVMQAARQARLMTESKRKYTQFLKWASGLGPTKK